MALQVHRGSARRHLDGAAPFISALDDGGEAAEDSDSDASSSSTDTSDSGDSSVAYSDEEAGNFASDEEGEGEEAGSVGAASPHSDMEEAALDVAFDIVDGFAGVVSAVALVPSILPSFSAASLFYLLLLCHDPQVSEANMAEVIEQVNERAIAMGKDEDDAFLKRVLKHIVDMST